MNFEDALERAAELADRAYRMIGSEEGLRCQQLAQTYSNIGHELRVGYGRTGAYGGILISPKTAALDPDAIDFDTTGDVGEVVGAPLVDAEIETDEDESEISEGIAR